MFLPIWAIVVAAIYLVGLGFFAGQILYQIALEGRRAKLMSIIMVIGWPITALIYLGLRAFGRVA